MAASASSITKIQQLYVAYYGRPGDPAGVEYWAGVLDEQTASGGGITSIIDAFGNSAEYLAGIGTGSTTSQVTSLYQQMFGRDPDSAGLAYWVDQIDNQGRSLGSTALAIAEGASGDDVTILANKVSTAEYYTEQVTATGASYDSDDIAAAQAIIASVTINTSTITTANSSTDTQLATQIDTVVFTLTDISEEPVAGLVENNEIEIVGSMPDSMVF